MATEMRFPVEIDDSQAAKRLQELGTEISENGKKFQSLTDEVKKSQAAIAKLEKPNLQLDKEFDAANDAARSAGDKIEELQKKIAESRAFTDKYKGINAAQLGENNLLSRELASQKEMTAEIEKQQVILNNAEAQIRSIEQAYSANEAAVQAANAKLEEQKTNLANVSAELEQQKADWAELARNIDVAKQEAADYAASFKGRFAAALDSLKAQIQSIPQRLWSGIKGIPGKLKSAFSSALSRIGQGFKSLFSGSSMKKLSTGFDGGLKSALKYGLGISSLFVLFNKLRKSITDSIQTFAQYDTETQASINNLKSALQGLKLQWGAAFAPILNAVAPVLQTLISWLNTAAQAVAQFIATLTGKGTFKRAIANTGKLSSNLGGAADNAKEAKKQLMGIDTLNVMNDTNTDTGSGGGGGGTADGSFEDVTVDAESLPAKIAAALKAGEWAQAATLLTDKLNEMVSSVDWAGIGSKIGYYLDGALTFLATALTTFDWAALAGSLAILLSNLISSVDWANLGVLFTAKFRILLLSAVGFLLNFDWGALVSGFSQFAVGFLNGLTNAISSVDWVAVGVAIWTGFVDIVEGIDWAGIGMAAINLLGAALEAAAALLGAVIGGIWETIVSFFNDFDEEAANNIVEGLLVGIITALANIGSWVKQNVVDPFVNGFKAAFGIHSPSTVMRELGGYVMEGLKDGITSRISAVVNTFNTVKSQITSKLQGLLTVAKNINWASIGVNIVNGIINGLNNGWQWLVNTVKNICNSLLKTAMSILGIHSPSRVFRDQIGENIGAGIEEGLDNSEGGILQSIKGISSDMLSSFNGVPDSIASRFSNMTLPPMPAVAMGTVVPPNAAGSSYGGISPELESKIDALLDRLNGGSVGKIAPSDVYLDKRKVGEIMYTYTEERNRGRGK